MKKSLNTAKKAKEVLPDIFRENACGTRHDFENLAQKIENSGDRVRPKEREDYFEEETVVKVDISKKEVESILSQFIPRDGEMPEVDAYDAILRDNNIIPVRDAKGRLLKGQQLVRKPKNIYSERMYKLSCDTCIKSATCPEYKEGYVCAFNKLFKRFNTRDARDIQDAIHSIVEKNNERLERAMMWETMDGGVIDPAVSQLMDTQIRYMQMIQQMDNITPQLVAHQRVVRDAQGNMETTSTLSANPNSTGGGWISQLFGGMGDKGRKEEKEDTIDTTAKDSGDID